MRPLAALLHALAALALGAHVAGAAPGINLGWSNCNLATNVDRTFACDDNGLTLALVGSFQVAAAVPDFVGVGAFLDFAVAGGSLPPWWQIDAGQCRAGQLGATNIGTLSGCVSPWTGGGQAGGYTLISTGPDRFRLDIGWLRDTQFALAANTLYSAIRLQVGTAGSFDAGQGACAGCQVPACMVLSRLRVLGLNSGVAADLTAADVRNWATWQGGTGDCPGATPSRVKTWGAVKALYR